MLHPPDRSSPAGFAHEREVSRLRRHFDGAFAMLAANDDGRLSLSQRRRRRCLVGELVGYRARGRFPKNTRFLSRVPFFVDAESTRCAMAHLIETTGHGHIVERVVMQRNHALVRELADDSELLDWLDGHGITLAEAARIQPRYDRDWSRREFCAFAPYADLVRVQVTTMGEGRVLEVHAATTTGARAGQLLPIRSQVALVPGDELLLVPVRRTKTTKPRAFALEEPFPALDAGAKREEDGLTWVITGHRFASGAMSSLGSQGGTVTVSVEEGARALTSKDCLARLRGSRAKGTGTTAPGPERAAAAPPPVVVADASTAATESAAGGPATTSSAPPDASPGDRSVETRSSSGCSRCSAHGGMAPGPGDLLCLASVIAYAALRRAGRPNRGAGS